MKYPYHTEYLEDGSPIMRLPKVIDMVTTFLLTDIQWSTRGEYYLATIDRVLGDEVPSWELTGNSYSIEIKKDFTQITDIFEDDETNNACVIETSELREIVVIWMDIVRNWTARRNKE